MSRALSPSETAAAETPWPLTERPGFLARRLHQIHVALFARSCASFEVTPVQYSLLSALAEHGAADLTTLAGRIALDRTTTTGAVKRLQARGLVERSPSRLDRRAQDCRLTVAGRETLSAMEAAVREAHDATLAPLDQRERRVWLAMTRRLVEADSGEGASPLSFRGDAQHRARNP